MTESKRQPTIRVVDTPCGPLAANCSTCANSLFVRGDRHMCEVKSAVVAGDSDCGEWRPLVLDNGHCLFGVGHGQVPEC